jgi:hypothetical protein
MVDSIKNFIKDRPHFIFVVVLIATLGTVLAALQGCNLASFVKVDVPPQVAVAVGASEETTLDEVDMVWADWKIYVETNTNRFERSIEDAQERYAVISQITDIGIKAAEGEISGLPGGTILLSGLSLLAGLFLKRPGEDARVAKEKRDSYNKGIEIGASVKQT